jgi:hypothetical protein
MIRILAFVSLMVVALMMPLWVFVLAAACYACIFGPYEMLALAILIDARFGDPAQGFSYMYTACAALIVLTVHFVRPRLRL